MSKKIRCLHSAEKKTDGEVLNRLRKSTQDPLSQCLRNPSSVGIFQALRNALSSPVDVLGVHRMALTSKMEN